MNKSPVLDFKYKIKKELLNIALSSGGDLDKMDVDNLILLCKQKTEDDIQITSPFDIKSKLKNNEQNAIDDLEKEQDAIWDRMNKLRIST
jgi:hypothetical protein